MAGLETATGVYSNTEILAAIDRGHIVCHPLVPEHINGSSVDVTLGEWYFRTDQQTGRPVFNPFDEDDVLEHFGEARRAEPHVKVARDLGITMLAGIPEDHPIIVVQPGQRILAHTHEFIGIMPPGTSSMQARSTWGRLGVAVCQDAGWGDPGYINRWTMEIYNNNALHAVPLPVGERIAQMVFFHTGVVASQYADLSGKYQAGANLDELIASWRPTQMLPRAYKDERELPRSVDD